MPFDEGIGTTAHDLSGNGSNMLLVNGPSWTIGKSGSALRFAGIDDYIDCESRQSFNSDGLTIMAWVKFNDEGKRQMIAEKHASTWQGGPVEGWWFSREPDGKLIFLAATTYSLEGEIETKSNTTIDSGIWMHLAATFKDGAARIYINGIDSTGERTGPSNGRINPSENSLAIGICRWCGNPQDRFFNGTIDEFKLYNKALTWEEITAQYRLMTNTITENDTTTINESNQDITFGDYAFIVPLAIMIVLALFLFWAFFIKKPNTGSSEK